MKDFEGRQHYPIDLDHLPARWAAARVGEVCDDIQSGFASGEHNSSGDGVPHVRPMNIDRAGRLTLAEVKYVPRAKDMRRLKRGDVVFNNTNSPVLVGKTCPILVDVDLAFSNHMTRLRPGPGMYFRFLAHQLHYLWMTGFFLHRCAKHVNQASVSSPALAQTVPVAIPPPLEQPRIVDALDSYLTRLDDALATLERAQRNLKRYRASVLKAAVEGRLVPTEAELARADGRDYEPASVLLERILAERRRRWEEAELARMKAKGQAPKDDKWKGKYREPAKPDTSGLPELPEGWCWATVESLSTKVVDGVHKKPAYVSAGVPFVTVRNLTAGPGISFDKLNHVTEADHSSFSVRANPERGDLLISKDGTLGVVRAVRTSTVFSIFVSVALVKPVLGQTTDYLEVTLSSPTVQAQMVPKGSGLQHIHLEDLRMDCVPLSPLAEQSRICDEVQRHLSLITELDREALLASARSSRLRQAILKWAFEGKLVEQNPNDEPASVLLERIRAARAQSAAEKPGKRRRQVRSER